MPAIAQAAEALHDFFHHHCPRVAHMFSVQQLEALRETHARNSPGEAFNYSRMRRLAIQEALQRCGYCPDTWLEPAFQAFQRARNQVSWYPDAIQIIPRLARRRPLIAITNGNACADATGLSQYFRFSLHARHHRPKPDPTMFAHAAKELGLAPRHILHVGDHPEHDTAAAAAAGLQVLWLNRGPFSPQTPSRPYPQIRNLLALDFLC